MPEVRASRATAAKTLRFHSGRRWLRRRVVAVAVAVQVALAAVEAAAVAVAVQAALAAVEAVAPAVQVALAAVEAAAAVTVAAALLAHSCLLDPNAALTPPQEALKDKQCDAEFSKFMLAGGNIITNIPHLKKQDGQRWTLAMAAFEAMARADEVSQLKYGGGSAAAPCALTDSDCAWDETS